MRRLSHAALAAALVVSTFAVSTATVAAAADVTAELSPPPGLTAVSDGERLSFGGQVPPGSQPDATLQAIADGGTISGTYTVTVTVDETGAVSGGITVGCFYIPGCDDAVDQEGQDAARDALGGYRLKLTVDDASDTSDQVDYDNTPPVITSYALTSPTTVLVRFSEDVTDPDGDAPTDWVVDGLRQVTSVAGVGDSRTLTFTVPQSSDATPEVRYLPTPSPDPKVPNVPYVDRARNELDAENRFALAADEIPPPMPSITEIEGEQVTYEDEDQAVPVLGNDPNPTFTVEDVPEGVTTQVFLDDGDGSFEPDTDDVLIGEGVGDTFEQAEVTSDTALADGVHRFYARSVDDAECDPNDPSAGTCPNASGRSQEARYDLETVAPTVGTVLGRSDTIAVPISEEVSGTDDAGQWEVTNGSGGDPVEVTEVSGEGAARTLGTDGTTLVDGATLTYTPPADDAYADEHGNELDGFTTPIQLAELPILTVEGVEGTEGDPTLVPSLDPPVVSWTLRLSEPLPLGETVEVSYDVVPGGSDDATPGDGSDPSHDHDDVSGTVTFATAGQQEATVEAEIFGDELDEFPEDAFLEVSGVTGATLPGGAVTLVTAAPIADDDPPATVAFADGSAAADVNEGTTKVLTVELDTPSGKPVEVAWRTQVAADPAEGEAGVSDVNDQHGTVTIPAGDTTGTFEVTVADDETDETDETFQVVLEGPVNAELDDTRTTTSTLTIIDDDLPLPTLSVEPGSVDEDDALLPAVEGAQLPYTFRMSPAPEEAIEVGWTTTAGGTATEGDDFVAGSGRVRFEAGQTEQVLHIEVVDDELDEDDETVGVNVVEPAGADLEGGDTERTYQGTIVDDDPLPTVAFADGSEAVVVTEGQDATFTVELDTVSGRDVTVDWATVFDGTATTDDLPSQSDTVTIAEGDTTATFTVTTIDDGDAEPDETVTIELSSPAAATLAGDRPTTSQLTLADDEVVLPTITLTPGEGDEDPGALAPLTSPTPVGFLVELSEASQDDVTVDYRTTNAGDATAESDFTGVSDTLTIPAGETSATIEVAVLDDDLDEFDETVQLVLSDPVRTRLDGGVAELPGLGTITDDDDPVNVSIADASVDEGEVATLTVTLDTVSGKDIEVAYETADGVGSAEAGDDYTSTSGTVDIPAGETEATFTVPTTDDADNEGNETVPVTIEVTDPDTATVDDGTATLTIVDNDTLPPGGDPVVSLTGAVVDEGNPTGPFVLPDTEMTFVVRLSEPADGNVDVSYETAETDPVSATEGAVTDDPSTYDYVGTSDVVTIENGQSSAEITVDVVGDAVDEFNEQFVLRITGVTGNAQLPPEGLARTGRIDDDDPLAVLGFADGSLDVGVDEGGTVELTVERTGATAKPITVDYTTSFNGLATMNDAPAQSGTVELAPGESSVSFEVETTQDDLDEPSEAFSVVLSNPSNAALDADTDVATVTITDDDLVVPVLSVSGGSVDEGAAATFGGFSPLMITALDPAAPAIVEEDLVFTVTLSEETEQEVTVDWTTSGGGRANAGSDYVASSGTLTIPAFETTGEVTIDVLDDELDEFDEQVEVTFSNPQGATLAGGASTLRETGTISDDDPLVTAELGADQEVGEGEPATFEVALSAVSGKDITLRYRTSDGSARAGQDYTATDDTLTIPAGDTSATFTIPTLDDSTFEPTEDLSVQLSVVRDDTAELGRSSGTLTITDDDLGVNPDDTVVSLTGDAVEEGDPATPLPLPLGGNSLEFDVRLSEPADGDVVIDHETRAGTATAGGDFEPATGQVTIPDGEQQATVSVAVVGDFTDEFDEDLQLVLTGVSGDAVIPGGELARTGRILDDDPEAQLNVSDATVLEGGVAELDVTLDNPSGKDVTVNYAFADGTATAGEDYQPDTGTLSFPAGTTSRTVQVATLADGDTQELIEQFELVLSGATNAGIDDGRGTISIIDIGVDGLPTVTAVFLEDATTQEGDTDTTAFVPVRLSSERDQDTTVTWSTQQLTATDGEDYRAEGGQVTIPAGATSAQIAVTIIGDDEVEPNEDFLVLLTEAEGAVITGPTGRVTIEDDDGGDEDGDGAGDGGSTPGGGDGADGARGGELPATGGGVGLALVGLAALLARRRRD